MSDQAIFFWFLISCAFLAGLGTIFESVNDYRSHRDKWKLYQDVLPMGMCLITLVAVIIYPFTF